ncbi:MAG: GNAT family N-acetyltransferase [Bacillus sp. (in: Bacteria)]|nr:GNAT family N-acetyltransferase [Bacillus sp. (in: firmicutes)]
MGLIKSIQQQHIRECTTLYLDVFNGDPWNDNWTLETAEQRLHDIYISPNFEGVVYVKNDQIKGAIFGNYEQFFDGRHYNLREMFVSRELQGTGIGSEMLAVLEGKLKGLGVTTTILFTSKGNKTSQFYLNNGFIEWDSMAMMGKDI